jgi:hypothetical protein
MLLHPFTSLEQCTKAQAETAFKQGLMLYVVPKGHYSSSTMSRLMDEDLTFKENVANISSEYKKKIGTGGADYYVVAEQEA